MSPPRYQEIKADEIPVTEPVPGARVKVVAGDVFGVRGPVETHSPIVYLHVTLQAGASIDVPIPSGHEAFAYVIRGCGQFGDEDAPASESQLVLFAGDDGDVHVEGPDRGDVVTARHEGRLMRVRSGLQPICCAHAS